MPEIGTSGFLHGNCLRGTRIATSRTPAPDCPGVSLTVVVLYREEVGGQLLHVSSAR
jgi:hypothetical protein